jgi:hypothetical protein
MVFLVVSPQGHLSFRALEPKEGVALWVAAGVLAEDELRDLRVEGLDVSDFNYTMDPNDHAAIAGAVETIKEHHPGQSVWVEG